MLCSGIASTVWRHCERDTARALIPEVLSYPWSGIAARSAWVCLEVLNSVDWDTFRLGDRLDRLVGEADVAELADAKLVLAGYPDDIRAVVMAKHPSPIPVDSVWHLADGVATLVRSAITACLDRPLEDPTDPVHALVERWLEQIGPAARNELAAAFARAAVCAAVALLARPKGWDAVALAAPWWVAVESGLAISEGSNEVLARAAGLEDLISAGDGGVVSGRTLARIEAQILPQSRRPGLRAYLPGYQDKLTERGRQLRRRLQVVLAEQHCGLDAMALATWAWFRAWLLFGGEENLDHYVPQYAVSHDQMGRVEQRKKAARAAMWHAIGATVRPADRELADALVTPWQMIRRSRAKGA